MSDAHEFALDVVENGDVILKFPDRVGRLVRFGYWAGRWTLVTATEREITATPTDRESVSEAIKEEDYDDVEIERGREDFAWYWYIQDGTSEQLMYRSYCMCGAFKCSTDINVVQRFRERHKTDCSESKKPNMQTVNDDEE